MKVIRSIEDIEFEKKTAIALGFFDGVHVGHKQIIESAVYSQAGLMPVVFTFSDHPKEVLTGEEIPKLITNEMRLALFEKLGVESVVMVPFREVRNFTPTAFFTFLKEKMKAEKLCYGFNYNFGRGGAGNAKMLTDLCEEDGMQYEVSPPVMVSGVQVSSTLIRERLAEGDITWVSMLLGRKFSFKYIVQQGKQVGRQIGFPTINQRIPHGYALPKFGVYASQTIIKGETWSSITNIGIRPTVGGGAVTAETHIFEYDEELYGEEIEVELLKFVRPEQKFESIEELRRAIIADMENVRSGSLWITGMRDLWHNAGKNEDGGNQDD